MEKPLLDYYPDTIICVCMEVTEQEIRNAIIEGANTVPALSKKLLIGTGCSSCICEVEAIIKQMKTKSS